MQGAIFSLCVGTKNSRTIIVWQKIWYHHDTQSKKKLIISTFELSNPISWAGAGVTCLYLTTAVLKPQRAKSPSGSALRAVKAGKGKWEERKRRRQLDCNSRQVMHVHVFALPLCLGFYLSFTSHIRALSCLSHTRSFQQVTLLYSRLTPVPYRPLDRRKWRTHDSACEPQNSKLWGEKDKGDLPTQGCKFDNFNVQALGLNGCKTRRCHNHTRIQEALIQPLVTNQHVRQKIFTWH